MAGKAIIIRIHNLRVYFNPSLSIPIENTNIPKESFLIHKRKDFFWKIELVSYQPLEKSLNARLIESDSNELDAFYDQKPKNEKEIENLFFESPDWSDLGMILAGYTKIQTAPPPKKLLDLETSEFLFKRSAIPSSNEPIQNKVAEKKIEEQFWINFSDIQFKLGYVTFSKKIKGIADKVEFKISNEHILAEFDNIKFWFAKALKTRKIKVVATIRIKGESIIESQATSPEIDKISQELIDSVKYQRTISLIAPSKIKTVDKSLFTAEDILDQFETEDIEGNVFRQSEDDILTMLIQSGKIRNRKQLEYLSGVKQSVNHKLRFTRSQQFGFLFFVEGDRCNHFVWELINSNATYIWSINKAEQNIELQYRRIEDNINFILDSGRRTYQNTYIENHIDNDLRFVKINHDNISSGLKDSFPEWRAKLNEKLI